MPDQPTPDLPHDAGHAGNQPVRESVLDLDIERELKDSYLTYAMSTIVDRALPDVRDGLKPSQRRILFAMHMLKLGPGRKHAKCAMICGETSGKYHPHGEGVVYPTLVGMAQDWRTRVPLVSPQGNFGSIDPDPPAAMRYTEARLAHAAGDMIADLELDTVLMQSNYDETRLEPTVLPSKFPNVLINGGMGIAVGMATSLPPHNPVEILDAIARFVENPAITLAEVMTDVAGPGGEVARRGVKGPDFPTGGIILGRSGIVEAYATGRGKVTVRGQCHVEQLKNDREQLVIDTIPYGLGQRTLVESIVDAVKEDRIADVSDVRNESGREARTRIVLELKKGADARVVENQLYEFTPLQQTFSIMNIVLVNRRPRTLGLLELIRCYVDHRIDVIRRRTAHLLQEAKKRAHVLEGLILAVFQIDYVIWIIRNSPSREEAIVRLMAEPFRIPTEDPRAATIPARLLERSRNAQASGLNRKPYAGPRDTPWGRRLAELEGVGGVGLSRVQAEAIGAMRLIQLVGLEIERLVGEYRTLVVEIEGYESILADPAKVRALILKDCEEMKARYASPRLTEIQDADGDISIEALIQVQDVAVTISHQGYCKRMPLSLYRQQNRGGKGIRASDAKDDDFIEHFLVASTHDDLLTFTNTGRTFRLKVYQLPELSRSSKGRAIVNLLDLREGEKPCAFLGVKDFESGSEYLTFVSRDGIVKRTPLKDYRNVSSSGLIAVGLKEGDALLDTLLTSGSDDLLLVTARGQAIRFNEQDVRLMGRPAAGVKGIELAEGDEVIGAIAIPMTPDAEGDPQTRDPSLSLLTITENGFGKRTGVDEYRVQPETGKMRSQSRGGKGRVDITHNDRNGCSVAALLVGPSDDVVVVTKGGQLVRMPSSSIREAGRGTQGVRVVTLNDGDKVTAASRFREEESPARPDGEPPNGSPGDESA